MSCSMNSSATASCSSAPRSSTAAISPDFGAVWTSQMWFFSLEQPCARVLQDQLTTVADAHVASNLSELVHAREDSGGLASDLFFLRSEQVQRAPCLRNQTDDAWSTRRTTSFATGTCILVSGVISHLCESLVGRTIAIHRVRRRRRYLPSDGLRVAVCICVFLVFY